MDELCERGMSPVLMSIVAPIDFSRCASLRHLLVIYRRALCVDLLVERRHSLIATIGLGRAGVESAIARVLAYTVLPGGPRVCRPVPSRPPLAGSCAMIARGSRRAVRSGSFTPVLEHRVEGVSGRRTAARRLQPVVRLPLGTYPGENLRQHFVAKLGLRADVAALGIVSAAHTGGGRRASLTFSRDRLALGPLGPGRTRLPCCLHGSARRNSPGVHRPTHSPSA